MGTNFYFKKPFARPLHIGKSSAGWCFSLHVIPEKGVNSISDWIWVLTGFGKIVDEYGTTLTRQEMMDRIADRSWPKEWDGDWWGPKKLGTRANGTPFILPGCSSEADFHAKNGSQRGPRGLLRHRVDGVHCVGQGSGTWDYIAGEFS